MKRKIYSIGFTMLVISFGFILMNFKVLPFEINYPGFKKITAGEVIEKIKTASKVEWNQQTVDTFKSGGPEVEVTGIATTFLATFDVLKRAKAKGLNLIITHEPTYYNHLDEIKDLENDEILKAKKKFIEDNGLIVWRFHDHWHMVQPDGIVTGMANEMGWDKNYKKGEKMVFEFPKTTLKAFAKKLGEQYPSSPMRVIGDPEMEMTTVALVAGAHPSSIQMRYLQRDDVEVEVVGEAREWETVEYVRDAVDMGKKKALIIMGHANSEEGGMEYCAEWLKGFIDEVPVEFVKAGDPFWTPK